MSKVVVFDHPLIAHKISIMRDVNTTNKDFRELLEEISMLMTYEVTRELPLVDKEIETPICKTTQKVLGGRQIGVVPILRAGLGWLVAFLRSFLPQRLDTLDVTVTKQQQNPSNITANSP